MINILIVDDVNANLETLDGLLETNFENINVIKALSAEEGLKCILKNSIDLILSDIQMPGMDGFDFAKFLQNRSKVQDIPIIFITAIFDSDEYRKKGFELGAIDYITKPINEMLFIPKIKTYIENARLKKGLVEKIALIEKQNETIAEQSRFASMGEMISMIAHQWRQPLSSINGVVAPLDLKFKMGMEVDPQDAIEKFARQNEIVQHLSTTIEDFLGFFKDNGYNEMATISQIIETPKRLISAGLGEQDVKIDVVYTIDENFQFKTKPSKFDQVLMNIYKNALDEFKSKDQKNGIITVVVAEHNDNIILEIQDNAGGIPEDVLPNIWDAYFSTKDKNGTGIGLYMTKILVEKHLGGTIKASNRDNGAVFSICIPIIK